MSSFPEQWSGHGLTGLTSCYRPGLKIYVFSKPRPNYKPVYQSTKKGGNGLRIYIILPKF